jgi:hypothetical protein
MKRFLFYWVWQFPQTLLGTILVKVLKAEKRTLSWQNRVCVHQHISYYRFERNTGFSKFISGVSLANIILLSDNNCGDKTIRHEYGHSIQSACLGWLYLPVIGIYSAVFCNLWDRWFHKRWSAQHRQEWYYSRWSEAWADRLGGVIRN